MANDTIQEVAPVLETEQAQVTKQDLPQPEKKSLWHSISTRIASWKKDVGTNPEMVLQDMANKMPKEELTVDSTVSTDLSEKEVREARDFFDNMPEHGVVIHGGLRKYSELKKGNGLKKYKDTYYYFIPKPDERASEADLTKAYTTAMTAIEDSAGAYSFGTTTQDYINRMEFFQGNDYTIKEFYRDHTELEPSLLCFKAPKELSEKFALETTKGLAYPVAAKDLPIGADNFLFEIKLSASEMPDISYTEMALASEKFKDKVRGRIKKGWSKDRIDSDPSFLEKNSQYMEIPDILDHMLARSHVNPIYAEAISRAKALGADIGRYQEVCTWIIEDAKLISKEELSRAKNPMAIYELTGRIDQIKRNMSDLSPQEAREKVLRMIGTGEPSRFKREKNIIIDTLIATQLKLKFRKSFAGMVAFGSQVDRYKPDSPEADVTVLINSSPDDVGRPYKNEQEIIEEIKKAYLRTNHQKCEPTVLYMDDLASASTDPSGHFADSIREVHNGLDYRSIPIIFGRKNRQAFTSVFGKNLKNIQTKY